MVEIPSGARPPRRPKRATASGLPRIARFGLSGGGVAAANVGAMTVLVARFGFQPQVALIVSYTLGLMLHFVLNRQWVFMSATAYHLRLTAQGARYIGSAATIYGLTALALATLPGALDLPALVVYYVTVLALSIANFFVLRRFIFRAVP